MPIQFACNASLTKMADLSTLANYILERDHYDSIIESTCQLN
jgi:hypothetical protein